MLWIQRCDVCKRPDLLDFYVPDDVWESVAPQKLDENGMKFFSVVCLDCFDKLASAKGIHYVDSLNKEMYFLGEMAGLELHIVHRSKPEI